MKKNQNNKEYKKYFHESDFKDSIILQYDETHKKLKYTSLNCKLEFFAKTIKKPISEFINFFYKQGMIVNSNFELDKIHITQLCNHYNIELIEWNKLSYANIITKFNPVFKEEDLVERSPVVTILGHVNHGKTTLLDYICKTKIVKKEIGNITQYLSTYEFEHKNKKIVILDTPGHEAFTSIRKNGASITDIVILVVSLVDGVQQQTIESIKYAKQNPNINIIVALNKMDAVKSQSEKIKVLKQLEENNIVSEENGGNDIILEISALKGINVDKLLDYILLLADVKQLKATENHVSYGYVIETGFTKQQGNFLNVIIKNGILKINDIILCNNRWFQVKFIHNYLNKNITIAYPSQCVRIFGIKHFLPKMGDFFICINDKELAQKITTQMEDVLSSKKSQNIDVITDKESFILNEKSTKKIVKIILAIDSNGSYDAILHILNSLKTDDLEIVVIDYNIGEISKNLVTLANIDNIPIYAFNVKLNKVIERTTKNSNTKIYYFKIIYSLIDHLKELVINLKSHDDLYKKIGEAKVLKIFDIEKVGKIAGCKVTSGKVFNNSHIKILRNNKLVHEGQIDQLKRFGKFTSSVSLPNDCGINIIGFSDIKINDIFQIFEFIKE